MIAAMIDGIEPVPEALVQLVQREQGGRIERSQELLADGTVMWSLQLCGPRSDFTRGVRLQPDEGHIRQRGQSCRKNAMMPLSSFHLRPGFTPLTSQCARALAFISRSTSA